LRLSNLSREIVLSVLFPEWVFVKSELAPGCSGVKFILEVVFLSQRPRFNA
jgi:hypothetical protein